MACVDVEVEAAKEAVRELQARFPDWFPAGFEKRVYRTIREALERHEAEACLIYAPTTVHAELVVESLSLGLHTLCVKPIATSQAEFRSIVEAHRARPELLLVQGQNKRWNPAAAKMREWLQEPHGIGTFLGGECRFWIRQNLSRQKPKIPDVYLEGLFFHSAASHQLDQLVAALGLPAFVTARVHRRRDESLGQRGVWGTAGGAAMLEFESGVCFCYTGTRAGHGSPFWWSGSWTFHGEEGDILRDGGHLQLFRRGEVVEDVNLQDLHPGLIEDDRIQFEAFARAIATGEGREWLQGTTLDTWILMEACNVSARNGERVDVAAFKEEMFGKGY